MFRIKKRLDAKDFKGVRGPLDYPDGCALDDGDNKYLVKSGRLYRWGSERAYLSWGLLAGECLPENVEHLKVVGTLGFREGSLLSKFSDGTLHLVSGNKTRHITDPDVLERYGLLGRPIWEVSDREFNLHDIGDTLDG